MSLLTCASNASAWRGYYYFKEHKVQAHDARTDETFMGLVQGSNGELYTTTIDVTHPRKSKCNCPHADGKRIVCKHMIALFFTAYPDEAQKFYDEAIRYQEEAEQYAEELQNRVVHYVEHMKKAELQQALLDMLFSGPEWQYDCFIRDHGIDYE